MFCYKHARPTSHTHSLNVVWRNTQISPTFNQLSVKNTAVSHFVIGPYLPSGTMKVDNMYTCVCFLPLAYPPTGLIKCHYNSKGSWEKKRQKVIV